MRDGTIVPHITRVEDAPCTRYSLDDQDSPLMRWKTSLPFPVHAVARTQAIDALSGGKPTTEYTYHHGYWDGYPFTAMLEVVTGRKGPVG